MDDATLLACTFENWTLGIGDPTVWGWVTVIIYAVATLVAVRVAVVAPFPQHSKQRERLFWVCLAVGLALLTVNKQLDLQSFMTAIARCAAIDGGWYENRRSVQATFLVGLGLLVGVLGLGFLWMLRGTMRRSALPLIGAVLVGAFVILRAVSFHAIDKLIHVSLPVGMGRLSVNFLLEAPGPLLILASGVWLLRRMAER